jgi:hypothetical protein
VTQILATEHEVQLLMAQEVQELAVALRVKLVAQPLQTVLLLTQRLQLATVQSVMEAHS